MYRPPFYLPQMQRWTHAMSEHAAAARQPFWQVPFWHACYAFYEAYRLPFVACGNADMSHSFAAYWATIPLQSSCAGAWPTSLHGGSVHSTT